MDCGRGRYTWSLRRRAAREGGERGAGGRIAASVTGVRYGTGQGCGIY